MGNLLGQSAPHEERIARLLGLPSERRLNQLLETVAVVCGRTGDRDRFLSGKRTEDIVVNPPPATGVGG